MAKPLGIRMVATNRGLGLVMARPTQTEDAIWDAVKTAQMEGWTPRQFVAEAKDAWAEALSDRAKAEISEFPE